MKVHIYISESGHSLVFLLNAGHNFSLTLYENGIPVFNKGYEYHQERQAEHDRDALVSLGHLVEQVKVAIVGEEEAIS